MPLTRVSIVATAVLLTLTGCDGDDATPTGSAGDVPVTAGALAYVAAGYTGTPDIANVAPFDWFEAFGGDAVAVDLRYHQTKYDFGDSVAVTVGTLKVAELLDCDASVGLYTQACEETPDGTLRWNLYDPEEDPGAVFVLVPKSDGRTVLVSSSGPHLTADPRTVDLPVTVDTLFDIAHDPRIDVTTSQEVVDRGAALPYLVDALG